MKRLVVILIIVLALVAAGAGYKTLVLNKPAQEPKAVVVRFMDDVKSGNTSDSKKLVSKNFNEEKRKQLQDSSSSSDSSSTKDLIYTIGDITMHGNDKATVIANVNAVILTLPVEFTLNKEGNWIAGYSWKITDLSISGLGNNSNSSDSSSQTEIKHYKKSESFTSKDIKIEVLGYTEAQTVTSSYDTTDTANGKFVLVEMNITNLAKESTYGSTDNVKFVDTQGRKFDFAEKGYFVDYKNGDESYTATLQPSETKKVMAVFDVPKDAVPDTILFTALNADVKLK